MKKMNENQLQNLEAGKFWGESCGSGGRISLTQCMRSCKYQVFWVEVATWDDFYPC